MLRCSLTRSLRSSRRIIPHSFARHRPGRPPARGGRQGGLKILPLTAERKPTVTTSLRLGALHPCRPGPDLRAARPSVRPPTDHRRSTNAWSHRCRRVCPSLERLCQPPARASWLGLHAGACGRLRRLRAVPHLTACWLGKARLRQNPCRPSALDPRRMQSIRATPPILVIERPRLTQFSHAADQTSDSSISGFCLETGTSGDCLRSASRTALMKSSAPHRSA